MSKKKIKLGETHGYIGYKPKRTPVKKEYNESPVITQYRLERDRVIYKLGLSQEEIKNHHEQ